MNIEAIRLYAQNKGDRKLLKLIEGESANREGVIDECIKVAQCRLLTLDEDAMTTAEEACSDIIEDLQDLKTTKPSPAMSASSEQGEQLDYHGTDVFNKIQEEARAMNKAMKETPPQQQNSAEPDLADLLLEDHRNRMGQQNATTGEGRE